MFQKYQVFAKTIIPALVKAFYKATELGEEKKSVHTVESLAIDD